MRVHISTFVIAGLVFVGAPGAAGAQTLGEVARKSEEARKTAKKGTKVYTNTDAGNTPAATVLPADPPAKPDETAKPATGQKPPTAEEKTPQKDQAYWGERMKALRTQLERDIAFRVALQVQINSLTTDFVNRDDPAQRAVIGQDRSRALAELDRLSKAIEDGKQAIADLEEEARRAGAPAGWLR